MTNRLTFVLLLAIVFALAGALLTLVFGQFLSFDAVPAAAANLAPPVTAVPPAGGPAAGAANAAAGPVTYAPPKLADAPENIRDAVLLGANILTDTQKYAAAYVGNKMQCANCHFNGGLTEGGKNGGLSLVGVAASYPKFRSRQNYAVDMVVRVNDCFLRSENGKPLPAGSREMTAILTYFQWISKGIPIYADVPWASLPAIDSRHQADKAAGATVFTGKCAACHGGDGLGTAAAPPLWGDGAYNDGAGMSKPATLAAFAHLNMPRGNPDLTPEQALDVGAYVDGQPRPHFTAQQPAAN